MSSFPALLPPQLDSEGISSSRLVLESEAALSSSPGEELKERAEKPFLSISNLKSELLGTLVRTRLIFRPKSLRESEKRIILFVRPYKHNIRFIFKI